MTRPLIAAAVMLGGCTFGFGSPYVGQWKAREATEFEVCVENPTTGECENKKVVTRHDPARKFWGFSMSYPMLGVAFPNVGGATETALRLEMTAEYLQGKGNFAFGLRQSAVIDATSDLYFAAPVMAMSHVGISDRLAAYGGVGFSWWNSHTQYQDMMVVARSRSHVGGRALAGLQLVGSSSQRFSRILYSLEASTSVSTLNGQTFRNQGLTLSIGLFL